MTEKPFILTYGVSGIGKTSDFLYSFPNALFVAEPGALKASTGLVGIDPSLLIVQTVKNLKEACALIAAAKQQQYEEIVFDDFSFLCEKTLAECEANAGKNKYGVWSTFKNEVLNFRNTCRQSEMLVAVNCWETSVKLKDTSLKDKEGNTKSGAENTFTRLRGGPKLPTDLPETFPAMCDIVLHAYQPDVVGTPSTQTKEWKTVYQTACDNDWIAKFRDHGIPETCPMNLGEILRFVGRTQNKPEYVVHRCNGMEWAEKEVERISTALLTLQNQSDIRKKVEEEYKGLLSKKSPQHTRWVIRDALHRVTLTKESEKIWSSYY